MTAAGLRNAERSSARSLGAYYTPPVAARYLARWAVRASGDRILEPSMGDGAFLHALRWEGRPESSPEVWGVEMAPDAFDATVASGLIEHERAIRADFLSVQPFGVDAVVGNPPYVRLRHLPADQADRAARVAEDVLGEPMDPSGSVWMSFVLHATRFLRRGGRLALVLPYELTHVRYARPLWRFLGTHFGSVRIVRVHERMFAGLLQETVLLLAEEYGDVTSHIDFEAYETVSQLQADRPALSSKIEICDVVEGGRPFVISLLRDDARELLRARIAPLTVPARELITFRIGYVAGDKRFFHPSQTTIDDYGLPAKSLLPALTSARQLRGSGLMTGSLPTSQLSTLFRPSGDLNAGERRYVRDGEADGVAQRYKCRTRKPWYITPYVNVPDVLLPVFTEKPTLVINNAQVRASNSLLCGYMRAATPEATASAWFTSLTVLQLELQVHALGGGVMVLVPREAGSIRLPPIRQVSRERIKYLDELLSQGKVDLAFESGDVPVLVESLGLSTSEVALIQEAVDTLAHWRTSTKSSSTNTKSRKDVNE